MRLAGDDMEDNNLRVECLVTYRDEEEENQKAQIKKEEEENKEKKRVSISKREINQEDSA